MENKGRNTLTVLLSGTLVVVLVCVVVLFIRPKPDKEPERAPGTTPGRFLPDVPEYRPTPSPVREPPAAYEPDLLKEIAAEFETFESPVWGVAIGPIEPGAYRYWFYLDGKSVTDPLNPSTVAGDKASVFIWPPKKTTVADAASTTSVVAGESVPRVISDNRAAFVYAGRVSWSLQFIAPFRDTWWGVDEFRPLNAAARANWKEILANPSLGVVQGMVVDTQRRPIAAARVRLADWEKIQNKGMGESHIRSVACDDLGMFRIDRVASAYAFGMARAAGYGESHSQQFNVPVEMLEFVLSPTRAVVGSVTGEAGRGIEGASVTARLVSRSRRFYKPATYTNAQGQYHLPSLTAGDYEFMAEANGFAPAVRPNVSVRPTGESRSPLTLDFVLSKGAALKGRVVQRTKDGEERGVEDALVVLTGIPADEKGRPARQTKMTVTCQSGPDGAFVFEHLAPNTGYRCTAALGALLSENQPTVLVRKGEAPPPITLYLPVGGLISGRVVDEEKKPIAGASVRMGYLESASRQTRVPQSGVQTETETDEAGRFVLENMEPGSRCGLYAEAEGFVSGHTQNVMVDSLSEVEIVLKRTVQANLSGRVVDARTKTPLGGMRLTSNRAMMAMPDTQRETVSQPDGTFEFRDLLLGYLTADRFIVTGKGTVGGIDYVTLPHAPVTVGAGHDPKPLELKAAPAVTIRGTILRKNSRRPVADAMVSVSSEWPQMHLGGPEERYVNGRADGTFEITGLPPGKMSLGAWKHGGIMLGGAYSQPKSIEAKPGETIEGVELFLGETGSVSGIVLDENGRPAPSVRLWLARSEHDGKETESDAEGRFRYSDIQFAEGAIPSKHRITVVVDGRSSYYGESEPFQLTYDNPDVEVTVRLKAGGSISGSVTEADGEAVAFAGVGCYKYGGKFNYILWDLRTDASGKYSIAGLPPDEYNVYLDAREFGQKNPDPQKVTVKAGEAVEGIDFVIGEKEEEEKGVLRGALVDLKGKPLPQWEVMAAAEIDGKDVYVRAETGHDGTFSMSGIKEAVYTLSLRSFSGPFSCYFTMRDVELGGDDSDTAPEGRVFIVPIGATLQGRIVLEGSGEPVSEAQITLSTLRNRKPPESKSGECVLSAYHFILPKLEAKEKGRFQIESMPVGEFQMTILSPSALPRTIESVRTTVDPLVTDLGDIALTAAKSIQVRLVDARTRRPFKPMSPGLWHPGRTGNRVLGKRASGDYAQLDNGGLLQPDDEGNVTIRSVPDDLTSLTFTTDDYFPCDVSPIELDPSAVTDLGTILLDPGFEATGRFVDIATGKPCSVSQPKAWGQCASGKPARYIRFDEMSSYHSVDADGRFVLRRVPGDIASLTFATDQYLDRTVGPIRLNPGGRTDLGDVLLDPGGTVRGKILGPNGEPGVEVVVFIYVGEREKPEYQRVARTNADGEFAVQGLPAGPATLMARVDVYDGENSWIKKGPDHGSAWLKDYALTVQEKGETQIEVRFPVSAGGSPGNTR